MEFRKGWLSQKYAHFVGDGTWTWHGGGGVARVVLMVARLWHMRSLFVVVECVLKIYGTCFKNSICSCLEINVVYV